MHASIVGILYVIATPIGNLQDITLRAVEILKKSDLIIAEDTRHSKVLLMQYGIQAPLMSLHEHNEKEQTESIIKLLLDGHSIALISDAGTPLVSDPGYHLVGAASQAGVRVAPIPGACALIAALSVSGLATDRFVFEGFLPVKSMARIRYLENLQEEERTLIFYEAPHRILEVLKDMQAVWGKMHQAVLAREMTKIYETIQRGSLGELIARVEQDVNQQRGEMVILVAGVKKEEKEQSDREAKRILDILLRELPVNQAVKLVGEITGGKRNKWYKEAIQSRKPKK